MNPLESLESRQPVSTGDGSHSLRSLQNGQLYHSEHGARQESQVVFIEAGFEEAIGRQPDLNEPLIIFEMGFGTGLNAFLTLQNIHQTGRPVHYLTCEAFPVELELAEQLNYAGSATEREQFLAMHTAEWDRPIELTPQFRLEKRSRRLQDLLNARTGDSPLFDLVYYDAFAPRTQPELWDEGVFAPLFQAMKPGGILTTYCSKSSVRRALVATGFVVEKLPGPPGKREIVRAGKPW